MEKLNIIPYKDLVNLGVPETKRHLFVYRQLPITTDELAEGLELSKAWYSKVSKVLNLPRKARIDERVAEHYSVADINALIAEGLATSLVDRISAEQEAETEDTSEDEDQDGNATEDTTRIKVSASEADKEKPRNVESVPHIAMYLAGESPLKLDWAQLGLADKHIECVTVCNRNSFSVAYTMVTSAYAGYKHLRTNDGVLSYIIAYLD